MLPATFCLLLLVPAADAPVEADYVLRGATVCDGSGQPGRKADVALKGDRIVAVDSFQTAGTPKVLDASGLVVAPGFIDLHTHSDRSILEPATRANLNYLTQGVTTVVTGNCGAGPVDVAEYYQKIDAAGAGTNVAHQMPHNDLRARVMGSANRPPTADELEKMKALIDKGMRDGVRPDQAVITADGIVGKVLRAFDSTSLVLLVNDQTSGVGVVLEKLRVQGVLRGTATGEVAVEKIMSDESVQPGE